MQLRICPACSGIAEVTPVGHSPEIIANHIELFVEGRCRDCGGVFHGSYWVDLGEGYPDWEESEDGEWI